MGTAGNALPCLAPPGAFVTVPCTRPGPSPVDGAPACQLPLPGDAAAEPVECPARAVPVSEDGSGRMRTPGNPGPGSALNPTYAGEYSQDVPPARGGPSPAQRFCRGPPT